MNGRRTALATLVWIGLGPMPVEAKAPDLPKSQGFEVAHSLTISAPASKSFAVLGQIGSWWNPAHSYAQKGSNMTLDMKAGGCFCETWGSNSAEHMRVIYVQEGKLLRMAGGLGPLQGNATGVMTVTLQDLPGGQTKLDVTYAVWGHFKNGASTLEAPVAGVLLEQFTRFKAYVETGQAAAGPAPKP